MLDLVAFTLLWAMALVALVLGFILAYTKLNGTQIYDLLMRVLRLPQDLIKLAVKSSGALLEAVPLGPAAFWNKILQLIDWIFNKRLPYL
jgi:hypothetical protein